MNKWKKRLVKIIRHINCLGLSKEKISYVDLVREIKPLFPELDNPVLYLVVHSTDKKENIFLGVPDGNKLYLVNNLRQHCKTSTLQAEADKYNLQEFRRAVIINHEQGYRLIIESPATEGKTLEFIEGMGQVWAKKV